MSGKLSRFQMRPFTTWNGVMKENSLAAMGLLAPQKLSSFMVQLLAFKNGKTLDTFLSKYYIGQLLENVTDIDGKTQTGYVAYICGKNDSVRAKSSKP